MAIDLRQLGLDIPEGVTFFLAYRDENNPNQWIEVPIAVHQPDGFFSAEVSHFSQWTTGWRPDGWTLAWEPPSAAGFSGAATYSHPLEVPPGRRGLQPAVFLSYSNSAMNGAIRRVSPGTVASGWSLNEIAVIRTNVKVNDGLNGLELPNTFRLVMNGAGYHLEESDPAEQVNDGTRWYAKDMPQLRVVRYNSGADNFWTVETADGTIYRLGYPEEARTWHRMDLNQDPDVSNGIIEWHVDTATDTSGNQLRYQRDNSETTDVNQFSTFCPWGGICTVKLSTEASRVTDIYYNFSTRAAALPAGPDVTILNPALAATRIAFEYDSEAYLERIAIYHADGRDVNSDPIREYEIQAGNINVENEGCKKPTGSNRVTLTRVVSNVVEYGWDGDTGTKFALPATTFEYKALANFKKDGNDCFIYKHLEKVQNGYGAETEFDYDSDERSTGSYVATGSAVLEYPKIGYSHYVSDIWHRDGLSNERWIAFDRNGSCYNQTSTASGVTRCQLENPPEYAPLTGFEDVVTTFYDYGGTTISKKEETSYHQEDIGLIGKPKWSKTYLGSVEFSKQSHGYITINFGSTIFTPLITDTLETYDEWGSDVLRRTLVYAYGSTHYGQPEYIYEYENDNMTPTRATKLAYRRSISDTLWLVNTVRNRSVRDGATDDLLRATWTYYDGNSDPMTVPTKGLVTRVDEMIPLTCDELEDILEPRTFEDCEQDRARQLQVTTFGWDSFGNQIDITTYTGPGYRAFDDNWEWDDDHDVAPTGPRTTYIDYDAGYHLYPIAVTNPAGQRTTFEIFGFDGVPLYGYQSHTGLLKQVVDANGLSTRYEYDPFGRLFNVFGPGDGIGEENDQWDGNPQTRYRYWDNTWNSTKLWLDTQGPFGISVHTRPTEYNGEGDALDPMRSVTYYDGFGRPVQEQSKFMVVDDGIPVDTVVTTEYDALGRVSCVTAPYTQTLKEINTGSSYIAADCSTKAATETTYDALGRPLLVEAPDGSTTDNRYSVNDNLGPVTRHLNVVDANEYRTRYSYDALDRLVQVTDYSGSCGSYWGYTCSGGETQWAEEASTKYEYDWGGNLITVTNNAGVTTTMSYDALGRKTAVSDPDMGDWTYAYDAVGNLVRQEDAEGQILCFYFNSLDRPVLQIEDSSPAGDCPALASAATDGEYHLASYVYGILPPNVGQVVEASWGPNPDQNKDLFSYDAQGRLARQERYLDGHLFAVESGDYDELDRPLTFKYPDGEIVTHTYDHEGLNALWAGSDPLVSDVWFNARGQVTLLDRQQGSGSAVDTVYTYYDQTDNFRLQTIRHGSTSDSLLDFDYGDYDLGGNILTLTTTVSSALSDTQTFEYDHHDRLVSADAMGGVANYNLDYEYDVVGNIITVTRGVTATNYIYDGQVPAQPQAVKGLQIGGQAVATYTYDLNGNMITRIVSGTASYSQTFNVQNRLVVITDAVAGETTRFFYDASGQRVKTVKPDGTVIYTPFPNYEEEHVGGVVNDPPGAPAVITQTIPSPVVIGEVGLISGTLSHANKQVTLQNSYTNPVVFARPLSEEGTDASVVRITDIQSNNFTLRVQEASNHNDVHDSAESVSYLVLEAGQWILDGGRKLEVGSVSTNATVGLNLSNTWYTVTLGLDFPDPDFQEVPVILSQVQTDNDTAFVKTRQQGVYADGVAGDFQLALEED